MQHRMTGDARLSETHVSIDTIISVWRQQGHVASIEALMNVDDDLWVRSRLQGPTSRLLTKGDLALIAEFAREKVAREYARRMIQCM